MSTATVRRAHLEALAAYVPEDRRAELAGGPSLPTRASGSVLFADISGFTQLTSRLSQVLGTRRGAEEVPSHLNRVYDALIGHVRSCGGSVIGFAGDAITCWFAGDDGRRAATAGLNMQNSMSRFTNVGITDASGHLTETGDSVSLSLKVSVAVGEVSRYLVGDPDIQLIDVIAGATVVKLDSLNDAAEPGEVVVDKRAYRNLRSEFEMAARSPGPRTAPSAWVVRRRPAGLGAQSRHPTKLKRIRASPQSKPAPAPALPDQEAKLAPWLIGEVKGRLASGLGDFLTELKPVAALFMRFTGIDYDRDQEAGSKLDTLVRWVQREVAKLGGTLIQLSVGDKGSYLYVAFGAPVAHEDDAVRCAAAALTLSQAARHHQFLHGVHVGIGLGVARTGAYGAGGRRTYGALGDETNMAARLMGRAENGTVLASQVIQRAVALEFELLAQPPVTFKGKSEPQTPYLLLRRRNEGTVTTFDEAVELPFVAREREIARIFARLEQAANGAGGVIAITGESGMGKSRVVARALSRAATANLAPAGLEVHAGECQSFERNTPFAVWRPVFRGLLGLEQVRRDDPETLATREAEHLSASLAALGSELLPRAPLLAPVIGLNLPPNDLTAALTIEQQGAARESLLLALLRASARNSAASGRALVLVLEDVHWQDSASEVLLNALAKVISDLPMAVVITLRDDEDSEGAATLGSLAGLETVTLAPLPAEDANFLAQHVLFELDLDSPTHQRLAAEVVARAEGNPLYLEEILNDIVAGRRGGAMDQETALPNSLHSLLLGRIDRLDEEPRSTLKVASVIGRTFDGGWLPPCRPQRPPEDLRRDLRVTQRLGLTAPVAGERDQHAFRNTLTADVAYESLSYAHRAELHTRLASFIEQTLPPDDGRRLTLLAHHFDRSNDILKRREYLLAAGRYAQAAFANQDAAAYYRRLLPLVEGEERLKVLQLAGEVATFTGDYPAAERHYREALNIAESTADMQATARSQRLLGELADRQGDHHAAKTWLQQARESCALCGDDGELTHVLLALGGNVLWQLGEYEAAKRDLDQAAELSQALAESRLYARAIHGLGNLDLYQGNLESARRHFQRTLDARRELGDELGVANSLNNLAIIAANLGETDAAEASFHESLAIRRRIGDTAGVAVALNNLGYMAEARGALPEASELYRQSLAARRELGDKLGTAVSLNNLGALARREGDLAAAAGHHREGVKLAHQIGNVREAANGLISLAAVAADTGELARGATLLAAGEHLLAGLGAALSPELKELGETVMRIFTSGLDAAILATARTSGQQMTFDEAVAFAQASSSSD